MSLTKMLLVAHQFAMSILTCCRGASVVPLDFYKMTADKAYKRVQEANLHKTLNSEEILNLITKLQIWEHTGNLGGMAVSYRIKVLMHCAARMINWTEQKSTIMWYKLLYICPFLSQHWVMHQVGR